MEWGKYSLSSNSCSTNFLWKIIYNEYGVDNLKCKNDEYHESTKCEKGDAHAQCPCNFDRWVWPYSGFSELYFDTNASFILPRWICCNIEKVCKLKINKNTYDRVEQSHYFFESSIHLKRGFHTLKSLIVLIGRSLPNGFTCWIQITSQCYVELSTVDRFSRSISKYECHLFKNPQVYEAAVHCGVYTSVAMDWAHFLTLKWTN